MQCVHWDLHALSTVAVGTGLNSAVSGSESEFVVHSKDAFGNPRDGTGGTGDGTSDTFLVTVVGPVGGTVVTSTARVTLTVSDSSNSPVGSFTLTPWGDGRTTRPLSAGIEPAALKAELEAQRTRVAYTAH